MELVDQKIRHQIFQEINDAVKKGYDNTKLEWKRMALDTLAQICMRQSEVTANEVTRIIKENPIKTYDNRAIGGLFKVAERLGWIQRTGIKVDSKAGHLSQIEIWQSKLFDDGIQGRLL